MAKDKKRSRKAAEPKKVEPILEGGDEEVEVEEQEEEAEDVPVGMNTGSDDGSSTGGDDSGEEDEDEAEDRRAVKRLMRAKPVQDTPVPAVPASHFDGGYKNKQRVLTLCSRGVTARARHLLEDLRKLIPHSKKEVKLDCKGKYNDSTMGNALFVHLLHRIMLMNIISQILISRRVVRPTSGDLQAINEIAEVKSCNNCLFLEARKRQDLYLWVAKTPLGPSVKLHLTNLHTMDELRLTGNAMLGSRPLLSFDASFDSEPHWRLIRALFTDVFGCPRGHPKSKPFIDRVMTFCVSNGRIWVRNYQIVDK